MQYMITYTLPFKRLCETRIFLKEVTYGHQDCIYLPVIKNTVKRL